MNFLLLGNGFDLHHGLPTGYIDMMLIFRHLTENSDVTYKNVGEILGSYKSSTSDDNNNRLLDYYQTYDEALKNINWTSDFSWAKLAQNRWYQYFCHAKNEELTWIDFELEIKNALEGIEQKYSCKKPKDSCLLCFLSKASRSFPELCVPYYRNFQSYRLFLQGYQYWR